MDEFVEIARLPSSTEANLLRNQLDAAGIAAILDGEVTAEWLSHIGPTSGVKLLVGHDDVERAGQILALASGADEDTAKHPFEFREENNDDLQDQVDPELVRAWHAAILGVIFFPPLLNLYSIWILFRERLFLDSPRPRNWRITATV